MRPLVGLRVGESSPGLHKTVDTPCSQWLCTPCSSQWLCTPCSMSIAHPNGCVRCYVRMASRKCDWENVGLCFVCGVVFCVHPAVHCVQCTRVWELRTGTGGGFVCSVQCLVWCAVCTIVGELRAGGGESGHCHRRHLAPIPSTLGWSSSLSTFKENITNMREMFTNDPRLNTFSSATVAEMENTQTQRLRAVKIKYVQGRHCKGSKVPAKKLKLYIVWSWKHWEAFAAWSKDNRTILQGHQLNSIWSRCFAP